MTKKLYRSRHNAKVCGVCGGIGEYFNVDPTLVRLTTIVAIALTQVVPGLLLYLVAAALIPREPEHPDYPHSDYNSHN